MFDTIATRVIHRELFVQILLQLQPIELLIAYLRHQGRTDAEIGRALGMSRSAVTWCMLRAQQRILCQVPDAAELLAGRRRRHLADREESGPP